MKYDFEMKEKKYEDAMSARYDRDYHESPIAKWHDVEFANHVLKEYHENDRVLDLGCASASLWPLWKEKLKNPQTFVGIDLSEMMIDEARKRFPDNDFRVGSLFDIPAETGSFDLVIVSSVFHHVPDINLPDALREIDRVLDEHGRLVGREPLDTNRLADQDGWFSGAIMAFRHLIYRLTHTREYAEPDNGPHHHAYDAKAFVELLSQQFSPKGVSFHFPMSSYVSRAKDERVFRIVRFLDELINHQGGHELFYVATKNFFDSLDIEQCIQKELQLNERGLDNPKEFMAFLKKAAQLLEKELKK